MDGSFWATRRLLLIANYTYTQSSVTSDDSIIIGPDLQPVASNLLFEDGAPLTGQSDHLVNLQFGIEDTDSLSQATFLLSYASERVIDRGPIQGTLRQPDIVEDPGFHLDFVLRQEARLFNTRLEFKFEVRNITGENYEEFQEVDGNRIEINTYPMGRIFSLGVKAEF
jgi:outer membrane receptor protein involved in Fe transport